jgi:hypothetical protein
MEEAFGNGKWSTGLSKKAQKLFIFWYQGLKNLKMKSKKKSKC